MSAVLEQLDATAEADVSVATGRRYGSAEQVVVRVRRRAGKFSIDDSGTAVQLAGKVTGWLEAAERIVAEHGLNVNRRGVVFVPLAGDPGPRLDRLVALVGETSLSVYDALLDDQDP